MNPHGPLCARRLAVVLMLLLVAVALGVSLLTTGNAHAADLTSWFAIQDSRVWLRSSRVIVGDQGWSPYFRPGIVVWDGGSIVGGHGVDPGDDYAAQTLALVPRVCRSYASVTAGADIADMVVEAPAEVDARYLAGADGNVCVVHAGGSDLKSGRDPEVIFDQIRTYCADRRDAGFAVVVVTILPRTDAPTFEAARAILNGLLRAHWPEFADGLADVAADPRIGDIYDNLDQRYYCADGKHPNASGYAVMASVTAPVLMDLPWLSQAVDMRLRNAGDEWGEWRAYAALTTWWLAPGDGARRVEAEYRRGVEDPVAVGDDVNVDTVRPTTRALRSVAVRRGGKAVLAYRVLDADPHGSYATVVLRILRGDKVVTSMVRHRRAIGRRLQVSFTCTLPAGSYRWQVLARDTAGNRQSVAGSARFVVR